MSHNHDDQPATTAGPCADETQTVPPPTHTAAELAWSLDDDDHDVPVEPQSWRSTAGIAVVLLASAGVIAFVIGVVGWVTVRAGADTAPDPVLAAPTIMPAAALPPITPAPMAARAAPSTVTVTPKPAPPTTVTVEASPPAPKVVRAPSPTPDTTDDGFVAALHRAQLNVYNPGAAVRGAHEVCSEFALGVSRADIVADVLARSAATQLGAIDFVADAVAFYCPEYAAR